MTKEEAALRIKKLVDLINHYRYEYHVLDRQEISEAALDSLKKELFDLETKFPDLIQPDSPTQRVGGKALDKFENIFIKRQCYHLMMLFQYKICKIGCNGQKNCLMKLK